MSHDEEIRQLEVQLHADRQRLAELREEIRQLRAQRTAIIDALHEHW